MQALWPFKSTHPPRLARSQITLVGPYEGLLLAEADAWFKKMARNKWTEPPKNTLPETN